MTDKRLTKDELRDKLQEGRDIVAHMSTWRHKSSGDKVLVTKIVLDEPTLECAVQYTHAGIPWVRAMSSFLASFEHVRDA